MSDSDPHSQSLERDCSMPFDVTVTSFGTEDEAHIKRVALSLARALYATFGDRATMFGYGHTWKFNPHGQGDDRLSVDEKPRSGHVAGEVE